MVARPTRSGIILDLLIFLFNHLVCTWNSFILESRRTVLCRRLSSRFNPHRVTATDRNAQASKATACAASAGVADRKPWKMWELNLEWIQNPFSELASPLNHLRTPTHCMLLLAAVHT